MKIRSTLALLGALMLTSCAFGQTPAYPTQPTNAYEKAPPNVAYASLFAWRDDMKNRLDKMEGKQAAAPATPALPAGTDQTALIYQLRLEIAQLSYQIALLGQQQQQQRQTPPAAPPTQPIQPIILLYSPGGPPIAMNPNPGPVIPLNPNPGPVIPLNPNPGPVIPLNPSPGPVVPLNPAPGPLIPLAPPGPAVPLNPNPGGPILLNPVPIPGAGPASPIPLVPTPGTVPKTSPPPPPPTGYQTFTPFIAATRRTDAVWQPTIWTAHK